MKIAYIGQMADVSTENGICKKIAAQAHAWMYSGHDVLYFSLVPTNAIWRGLAPLQAELVARGTLGQRAFRSLEMVRRLRSWRPDVIYFRYAYHSAGFSRLFRDIPTVAEINSDDLTEYPLTLSRGKLLYHHFTRTRLLKRVTAFVAVTHELGQRFSGFRKPTEVIGNGIDLAAFVPAPPPDPQAQTRLFFVGTPQTPWHGLERLTELASLFPEVAIDVVGDTEASWRALSGAPPPPPSVTFHGTLPRPKYEPLLHRATAAIGTLGLFQKKMDEACPLKVREYLAAGVPVLAGYHDTDVPAGSDFFLQLPNNSASLGPHRERIAAWIEHWRTHRVPRASVAHLDNAVKEKRRLDWLARFARARNSSA